MSTGPRTSLPIVGLATRLLVSIGKQQLAVGSSKAPGGVGSELVDEISIDRWTDAPVMKGGTGSVMLG